MNKNILIILVSLLFNFGYAQTNTWTGAINTAWENDLNWSLGVAPEALEDVVIPPVVNQPVISTAGVTCAALTLGAGSSLTISASGTLAVIAEITITAPTFDNGNTTLAVGSGTLAAGGITMEAGVNDTRKCHLTIDTGTANVVGNVIMTGSALQNNIAFTSIGSLNIGSTMTGGSLTPGIGEVNYNGSAAQIVGNYVYDNLTLSGAGIKTFDSAIAVNNTLSIEAGVIADLGTFIHSTFLLSLNGSNSTGTWGGVGSAAINISPTFFAANSGIVNVGPPTVQASNLVFTNTTSTSTTINWTNGNGASRVVFVYAGASGSAAPLNYFPYTPNSVFGLGTEIGSSGWFCVYQGIGTTVDLTGLSPSTTYQVMTLEYNGSLGNELHLTATSTGNPAGFTTAALNNNIATLSNLSLSAGNLSPAFASGTTNYTATVDFYTTAITVTPVATDGNATITVNGVPVISGNTSGTIALNVGSNVITKIVTATDGISTETYTLTITRLAASAPPPIITSFSPENGPVGTTVIISGSNFGATLAENTVFFGAVQAVVIAATTTSLTVTVPIGSTYQPISVTNTATVLIGYSMIPFTMTFTPNKGAITIDDILPKVNFTAGSVVLGVANGDFDGDGKDDLVSTNAGNNSISVFRNTAVSGTIDAGSFGSKIDFTIGTAPKGVRAGDFDGDGKLDLAVANLTGTLVSIFRNISTGPGNINFANQVTYIVGASPSDIAIGDVDGDGKTDVVTSNLDSNNISVLRNISSGIGNINFDSKVDFAANGRAQAIGSGDLDGDGKMDIITANLNSSISVFRNISTVGTVGFAAQVAYGTGASGYNIAVGDFNKDGKPDIAAANAGSAFVSVFKNTSSGIGNINFDPRINVVTANNTNGVAISDIDGDGNPDLVAATSGAILAVFRNTSPVGGAITFGTRVDFANNTNARNVIIGDFDGDGKNDIATANGDGNNISVFRNDPLYPPTIQATNVTFVNTTETTTTASWTVGNGLSRAVFMYAGSSGSPLPVDHITYTANPAFGTGTQIGTSGWYCIYNGTGTSVDITGLLPATTYQVMAVEYNGSLAGRETYLSTVSTGNPASVTTISNIATLSDLSISSGTLTPVFATATTAYTATVSNAVTSLTLTPITTDNNATVTVNGVTVVSGSASGAIALVVGPNVITTIVTAQDGTTIETYTITVTRTEPTIVTTGTLSALTTIYGTPSVSGTFNVSGTDMAEGILVTAPTGFEVSSDDLTFTNSVTIGAAGIIASTPVYIRLKGTIPAGTYSGDIVLTSNNATTVNVAAVSSTVTPAALTITADDKTKMYGDDNPTLTLSYSGFVNGDTVGSLTLAPITSAAAVTGSPVGDYTISVSGAANPNYTISYVDGTLTITKALLTITADDKTKVYGEVNPTLTASYSGFVNGDTATNLTTAPTISTTALDASPVGTYTITASGAVSDNYDFTYVNGTLTITKATLTITADDQTKVYGAANPTLTASYSGFANGETSASLTTLPTISTTALDASPVGAYTITASGAVSDNYDFTYVNGNLTITKALLTITADDKTKVYGEANPTLTASYSGFVNGDTATNLTTAPTIPTTALDTSPVGTYTITASGAVSDNYDFTYVNGTLTITKALLTITADDKTKVYGTANPTLTASYSGFVNGDTATNLTTAPTISTTALDTSPVGTYTITASGAVSDNYDFTYVNGTLTITKATLTITADDQTKVYGAANPTLTASYSGFANGDTSASLTTLPTITTTALDTSPVGTYTITASGAVSDNYDFTYVNGNLTITKALLTITADDKIKVYGTANPTLTASYSGFVNGDTATNLTTAPTITTIADDTSPVGTYTITASGAVSDNYDFTYVNGNLTITKALLTITADDQTKVYGEVNPTLTASYSGFVNGDTATNLTTAPTITTTALDASPVGTYTITASGAVSDNYDFTYVNGNLTITKALLTITADDQTKVYGEVNPTLTVSYSGFVNGDTATNLTTAPTITTIADDTSPVGIYTITASGAVSDNYDFTYVNGNLTITKALLTITADDKTKVYGTANPTLTASYLGFVNGDTATNLTTAPTITTIADDTSPVGTYTITASGAVSDNYDFTYVNGNLTITKATLTITADDQTKVYGAANPTLTASYSGFANGETSASLTTLPTISTTALDASPVGTYTITASGAVSDNYDITYVNGNLTITKAALTITADDQTKVYGTANPTLTASYSGFVNGDTATNLITPPTISTTALDASPVGTYTITASGAVSDNYDFTYVNGNLTITKALLTITADDQTKVYGEANPTLTASYSGFVNGDTATNLITPPTISTTALDASPVGTYTITASGAVSDNYDFTYVNGNLTITKALLTITADDQTKVYGEANPTLTASYSGFVNGDTATNLTTPPTITTIADATSPVGTYIITPSGAVSDNYDFTYVNGNLTITKATLTITADDQTKVYGTANPTLTAGYLGFVNGDTATNLTTAPTITTTALDASPVGTYTITASGAVSDNYDFTYVNGNLTITKATLTITADDQTKVYGAANPTLTASYSGFANGETSASLTTLPTISTTALDASPVGTYTITASGAVSDNYDFTYVNGNLTITKALLTITADDKTKVYGEVNPTLTASYSGFVNGDTATNLTTAPTISTTALDTSPVGTYTITASGAVSDNYDITYVNGTLTITKAALTITADDQTKVYGTANPTLTASYSGFVNGDTATNLTTPPTISTTALDASPVGIYTITANGAVSDNYDITYVNGNLTITKALLTITADDKTKVYGTANPTLTLSYSGFVNGDTVGSLTLAPITSAAAVTGSPVGDYTISVSGAANPNYTISYVDGTLTITKALLTITADDKIKVYGTANPTLTASYSGFVNGDTATNLTTAPTISTTALDASPVGTYTITASGAVSDNYDFTYVNGNLTITKATLTITADDKTKVYGTANPTLTASYSGFVNGDTSVSLITLPTITTIADATSPVGTYTITASGAVSDNYDFTYVNGNLTITKAFLTITADDKTKVYGEANPTLTASYSGFVNGDTSVSLITLPTITTIADDTSPVGTYTITASGAVSDNYDFTYVNGTLTITKALLTITADDKTKVYGEVNPTLTASYSGFVNGDTATNLTTPPTIITTALDASPVGTYAITASGAVSDNYDFTYVNGTLTITKATLIITADNQTKVYGEVNPTLTASYLGFVNGDTSASLTTLPTISTIADDTSPVGTYAITVSGAASDNYTINYVDGTLTITGATLLTIIANDQSKIYGEANPTLTVSYVGFVNGDTEASLTTLPTITTTAVQSSPVGTYPITASGAINSNYTISYVPGVLTVTPANLAIAADDKTKIYGEANPPLTLNYTGFVNGDTEASLLTPAIASTTADATSPVGSYPITISGATSLNYTIGYTSGATLTVTPANLAIAADDKFKIYGEANPPLTLNYTGFVNGDTEESLLTPAIASTTANATSPVGSYPITISGATSLNYTIGYTSGATLTVTPANLTITANNQTKTYGSVNPTLTTSYSGFVNGDTASSFITLPTIATTSFTGSSVGTYPITASGAVNPNYAINYVDGTLTVTTATLTITADNQSKTYGSVNPTLTTSYSGFVNGDTALSFSTLPTISTTAVTGSSVGTYPITASGAVSPNYAINYVDGTLTVTTATLTITADNQSKTYGSVNPTLTTSYSGFVNGDTAASFTTLPTVSTTAVTGSTVGIYPITASGAVNPNYTISYFNGNLTVTTASLTITADNKTRDYGAPNPVLTASYSGFVNGDTSASLTTQPIIATIANTTSPVGVYAITVSGAVGANYNITYVTGVLTIVSPTDLNLASLTVNNGTLNPAFSPNVLSYTVNVASTISSEAITAIADDPLAKITINGITVQGGSPYTIALVPGQNTVIIRVVGEDGITTKSYTLNIIREKSSTATLSNLTISEGTLNPVFESDINNYSALVKYDVASINVRPTTTDLGAKITVNGLPVSSGTSSAPVTLIAGENIIETIVTAQDGITKETYTIIVYKGISPDQLVVNNILSPNGDGKNDFWQIKDIELFPNNMVTVYDRAGRIVYSKKSYSNEWDGSYSGSPLNNDTYYYLIDLGDNLPKIKGFITMLRD
ncbi:MBG domain-containing protein [Flavobacterium piscisymbiosum]|uniref:Cadherin-like beta sandwich domain-containing protein n=1 Tax=Flavobacterium piscisymbiosum TaxID=2893753 RepID=A0ABS8MIY6_9FLAO|nr:MBG domain-containing protein [Flavobacterium sp. F-30]MCC9065454.1 cadherin-like beta sandwich domain-containing protein [Flavobacterium sp. F-30]